MKIQRRRENYIVKAMASVRQKYLIMPRVFLRKFQAARINQSLKRLDHRWVSEPLMGVFYV